MKAPCEVPERRNEFWITYRKNGYEAVQTLFGNNTFKGKMKYLVLEILQLLHVIGFIKKVIG